MPNLQEVTNFLFVMFCFSMPATFVSIFGAVVATRSSTTFIQKVIGLCLRLAAGIIAGVGVTSALISISVFCLGYVAFFLAVPILLFISAISCWAAWRIATMASIQRQGSIDPILVWDGNSAQPIRRSGVRQDTRFVLQLFGLMIAWFASGLVFPLAITANQGRPNDLVLVPIVLVRLGILTTGGWVLYKNLLSWKTARPSHDPTSHYLSPLVGWGILGAVVLLAVCILAYAAFFTE